MTKRTSFSFWFLGIVLFFISVYVLRGVLLPFVAGIVLAYFLDPVADKLESFGMSRTMATVIITTGFILFAVVSLFLLIPILQGQVFTFAQRLPTYSDSIWQKLEPVVNRLIHKLPEEKIQEIQSYVASYTGSAIKWVIKVLGKILSKGMAFFSLLSLIIISPIVSFYMLRDWDKMIEKIDSLLPRPHLKVIREQFLQINKILAGFLRGQLSVCLFLGIYYGVGLTLAGIDVGLIVGLVSGLISFVPYLGSIVGFLLSIGLAFAQSSDIMTIGIVAGVFFSGQFIEGNFLTPRLVGKSVGLHPVWIIFALLAGGYLFGFLGVLIAVPFAAVIGVLVRFFIGVYKNSALYKGHQKYRGNRRNKWNNNYKNKKKNQSRNEKKVNNKQND